MSPPGNSPRIGDRGHLSMDGPSHGRPGHGPSHPSYRLQYPNCRPSHSRGYHHRPRPCVGFGFYHVRSYCPTYYLPYYVAAPTYVYSPPPIIQETVVVVPPTVAYTQPPVGYAEPYNNYGYGGYTSAEPPVGMSGTVSTDVEPVIGETTVVQPAAPQPAPQPLYEPAPTDTTTGQGNGRQLYTMMYEGTKQFSEGAYEAAARLFLNVTLQDPANIDASLAYAVARFATGDYAVAAIAIRRGVSRLPDIVNSPFDIRDRYGNQEDLSRHIQALNSFLVQQPDNVDALVVAGFVQHFTGQRDAARGAFEQLRQISRPDAGMAATFLNAKPLPEAPAGTQTAPSAGPQSQSMDTNWPEIEAPSQRVAAPTAGDSPSFVDNVLSPYVEVLE
ncbi:MAG TPA: hypothetical protein VLM89_17315 [Phycisphaerae bacterium]|nr:hypothetical protein [Phycisphaerae bacterium]